MLQNSAYHSYCNDPPVSEETLPFKVWCQTRSEQHPQFYYWNTVMELELLMLQFIRSLREGNFNLYLDSLNQLAPWFFALDRVHYARWLPVHIRDMNVLNSTHPSIHSEFQKGNFVVQRSIHQFSCMAMDQSHEQLNKSIKGEGGAVGLTEDPGALRRWMIGGPELSRLVTEFEDALCDVSDSSSKHHEQVPHIQMTFAKDVKSLVVTFEELGNPFLECSKELVVLDTKIIMHDKAIESVMSAKQLGIEQYHAFVADRIVSNNNTAITDTLSKNSLPLFHSHVQRENSKSHSKAIALKRDCHLFSRLYIACQSREADLEQFFTHENQPEPPSISSQGRIRLGTKSDLLHCLESLSTSVSGDVFPDVTAHIIDGATIVNMKKPKVAKTFGGYVNMDLAPYFMSRLEHVNRLDIVWDQYFSNSLKEHTRKV